MSPQSKVKLISVLQFFAVLILFLTFICWAPWIAAMPRSKAMIVYGEQIPQNWKAVIVEHGKILEWKLGSVSQNPIGFTICTVCFVGMLFFIFWSICYVNSLKKTMQS